MEVKTGSENLAPAGTVSKGSVFMAPTALQGVNEGYTALMMTFSCRVFPRVACS